MMNRLVDAVVAIEASTAPWDRATLALGIATVSIALIGALPLL